MGGVRPGGDAPEGWCRLDGSSGGSGSLGLRVGVCWSLEALVHTPDQEKGRACGQGCHPLACRLACF